MTQGGAAEQGSTELVKGEGLSLSSSQSQGPSKLPPSIGILQDGGRLTPEGLQLLRTPRAVGRLVGLLSLIRQGRQGHQPQDLCSLEACLQPGCSRVTEAASS